jgi:hypothetical protein
MYIRNLLKHYFRKILFRLQSENHKALTLLANQVLKSNIGNDIKELRQSEFRVFSQYGEDGIIQYLVNCIDIPTKIFVEFGVEDYIESNTRYLLVNNNWQGLILDGSALNVKFIRRDDIYWRHNLEAVRSFITKENINASLTGAGITGDIGLLSIDIDGNDYWIWNEINVISPRIVIVEYNSVLGPELKVTVPYDPNFVRTKAHYSGLYFGSSLAALCDLASKKGYYFIGCNSNGNNAFFIRNDLKVPFSAKTAAEGYVKSEFRESRSQSGKLTFLAGDSRLTEISHLQFYDLGQKKNVLLREALKAFQGEGASFQSDQSRR